MIFPYEKYCDFYETYPWWSQGPITCKRTYEYLPDSDFQYWRKGDLIKFKNGLQQFYNYNCKIWQEWFLDEKSYIHFLKNHKERERRLPYYAAREYALIIGKYRIIKEKYNRKFYDYGSVILMLTGLARGHVRKYNNCHYPFYKVGSFPYKDIPTQLAEFEQIILDHKERTDQIRNSFVSKIYKILKGG
ncbi:MAG: hypothetical protein ACFFG0_01965 [Candidatus Thorarchaeota archaeon]